MSPSYSVCVYAHVCTLALVSLVSFLLDLHAPLFCLSSARYPVKWFFTRPLPRPVGYTTATAPCKRVWLRVCVCSYSEETLCVCEHALVVLELQNSSMFWYKCVNENG